MLCCLCYPWVNRRIPAPQRIYGTDVRLLILWMSPVQALVALVNAVWNLAGTILYFQDLETFPKVTHIVTCILSTTLFVGSATGLVYAIRRRTGGLRFYHRILIGHFFALFTLTIVGLVAMGRNRGTFLERCDEGFAVGVVADEGKCSTLYNARVAVAVILYLINLVTMGHLIFAVKGLMEQLDAPKLENEDRRYANNPNYHRSNGSAMYEQKIADPEAAPAQFISTTQLAYPDRSTSQAYPVYRP